jgi:uncharacterized membrane protein
MSTTTIIIIAVAVVVLLAVAIGRSGPRVTQIDRTVRRDKEGDEQ